MGMRFACDKLSPLVRKWLTTRIPAESAANNCGCITGKNTVIAIDANKGLFGGVFIMDGRLKA